MKASTPCDGPVRLGGPRPRPPLAREQLDELACIGSGIVAAERIEPGEPIIIGADGRAYLADRDEAARRAAVERAIERHLPPDDAPPAAGGDVSPGSADDGADAAVIARGKP